MTITLDLAENIARILQAKCDNLPRFALESLALEAYRAEITTAEVQQLLGYDTAYAMDGFLKEHGSFWTTLPRSLSARRKIAAVFGANDKRNSMIESAALDDRCLG